MNEAQAKTDREAVELERAYLASIQVSEEMIFAGACKVAEMCGHDEEPRGWDRDVARNVYFAMKAKESLPQGDGVELERLAGEICNGLRERPVANKWIVAASTLIEQLLHAALVRSKLPIDRYAQPCSLHEYIQPNCPACGKLESAPIGDDVRERVARAIVSKTQELLQRTFGSGAELGGFDGYTDEGKAEALEVADAAITAIGSQSHD